MKKQRMISILIILLSFILAVYFYPELPDQIPTHWNAEGKADAYGSKEMGLFLMPVLSIVIYLLLVYLPYIDPLKMNVEKFREYYEWTIVIFLLFFLSIQVMGILWSLGYEVSVQYIIFPGIAVIFYVMGELMKKSKRNWFIGIRTPWTLSSEKVWDKTHKVGAKLFQAFAIFIILALVLGFMNIWVIAGPAILIAVWSFVYSYLEFSKLKKK